MDEIQERVLKMRYYQPGEDWGALVQRVVGHVGRDEPAGVRNAFATMLHNCDFLPNSPCLMNAGTNLGDLCACYVLPIEDSMESIFSTLKHMAMIQRSGGGTGFTFSHLRSQGSPVRGTGGVASGPVSFLKVYDAATNEIKQGGRRRGANMAVLRYDHPDILKFISAKALEGELTNFNISVAVDQAFFIALREGLEFALVNPLNNEHVGNMPAKRVMDAIAEACHATGDPGMLFLHHAQAADPLKGLLGTLESTNPCGETWLLPYEACVLGSINLSNFVLSPFTDVALVDADRLRKTIGLAVRFLDDVISTSDFSLSHVAAATQLTRKIGLGVMGFADLLLMLGIPYDSQEGVEYAGHFMEQFTKDAHEISHILAQERGAYPAHNMLIAQPGVEVPYRRNATCTVIAPTGSISLIAGCSSGIEPYYALSTRHAHQLDGTEFVRVSQTVLDFCESLRLGPSEYGRGFEGYIRKHGVAPERYPGDNYHVVKPLLATAHEISWERHIEMQAAFQGYTDNAVSKTINMPRDATVEDVKNAFLAAEAQGCKGITVYRDGSKESQVLYVGAQEVVRALEDVLPRERPRLLVGFTTEIDTGLGRVYVTVNELDGRPFEVFAQKGKAGTDVVAFTEAIARLASLALRCGVPCSEVASQLVGIGGGSPSGFGDAKVLSIPDAIGRVLVQSQDIIRLLDVSTPENNETDSYHSVDVCPECDRATLVYQEGCDVCTSCGYSRC